MITIHAASHRTDSKATTDPQAAAPDGLRSATHVHVGNPLFTHTLFPTYVAALLWGGLWLRDERVRSVLPLRAAE